MRVYNEAEMKRLHPLAKFAVKTDKETVFVATDLTKLGGDVVISKSTDGGNRYLPIRRCGSIAEARAHIKAMCNGNRITAFAGMRRVGKRGAPVRSTS